MVEASSQEAFTVAAAIGQMTVANQEVARTSAGQEATSAAASK